MSAFNKKTIITLSLLFALMIACIVGIFSSLNSIEEKTGKSIEQSIGESIGEVINGTKEVSK